MKDNNEDQRVKDRTISNREAILKEINEDKVSIDRKIFCKTVQEKEELKRLKAEYKKNPTQTIL